MKKLGKYLIYDEYSDDFREAERYFKGYARENYLKYVKTRTLERTGVYGEGLYRGFFLKV